MPERGEQGHAAAIEQLTEKNMSTKQGHPKLPKPKAEDMMYAYQCAADFLDLEEWPEEDGGAQVSAYREVAKRLRKKAEQMQLASLRKAQRSRAVPNSIGYGASKQAPAL